MKLWKVYCLENRFPGLWHRLYRLTVFRESGMPVQADPWVSAGPNMGISPKQLQEALGSSTIGQIASQLGVSQDEAMPSPKDWTRWPGVSGAEQVF